MIVNLGHLIFVNLNELLMSCNIRVVLENRVGALQMVSVSHRLLGIEKDESRVFIPMN